MDDDPHSVSDVLAVAACLREALRQKDVPVALSLMTDDVVFVGSVGPPIAGLDSVRAALSSNPVPWKYEVEDETHDLTVEVLGTVAIRTSHQSTVITPESPAIPTVTMRGRVIAIYRRRVDGWKLARYISLLEPVKAPLSGSESR